jgi:peptidoglycan/LPS O-acetylase OafA/YrhL
VNRRATDPQADRRVGPRLGYIDGLRAVAVLLVMLFHARVHMPGVPLGHLFLEGTHGVDLFFVLSGFCLSVPTLQKLRDAGTTRFDLIAFAAKRFLRIFPPYAVAVVLFAAVGTYALHEGISLPPGMRQHFELSDVASELLFFDRMNEHINQSFWSLALEFRWYFIFPVALAIWAIRPRALIALIFAAVFASELTRATSIDLGVMPAFLLGIVAAQIRVDDHPIAFFAPLLGIAGVVMALALEHGYHFPVQTNFGWHVVAFALVVTAGRVRWLQRLFAQRGLIAIGTASYSIYLVHEPIISATVGTLGPKLGSTTAMLVAIALGLAGGFFMWAIVERPLTDRRTVASFVTLSDGWIRRLFAATGIPLHVDLGGGSRVATADPGAASAQVNLIELQTASVRRSG